STERVIDSNVQVIAAIVGGGHEMKVLITARRRCQVRQRNVGEQSLGNWVDCSNRVVRKRRTSCGIKNLYGLSCISTRRICRLREVSLPFQQSRDRRKLIERIFSAASVVIDEKERLCAAVIDLRDI